MGLLGVLVTSLGGAALAGCHNDGGTSDVVYTRARPDADFASYTTFAIVTEDQIPNLPDPPEQPPALPADVTIGLEMTEEAVREQMGLLGFTEVAVDADPDLYVFDFAATQDEEAIYWECVPGYLWWGWYWYWDPCAWLAPVPVEYTVGSVLVLLIDPNIAADPEYGQVVFGGLLQGVADGSGDMEARIDAGVARMFAEYPAP
jgi:hypothetical protein